MTCPLLWCKVSGQMPPPIMPHLYTPLQVSRIYPEPERPPSREHVLVAANGTILQEAGIPLFEIERGPTISLEEVRTRRFNIIEPEKLPEAPRPYCPTVWEHLLKGWPF